MMTNGTILAVDDDDLALDMIRDSLREAGFDVVTAVNGAQALSVLLADPERFDVLVVDRVMPVMDGMEFLRAVRQNEGTANIPIVLQTVEGQPQAMKEGIEAGAFYYLTKPYDESTLVAVVRSAVQSHNQVRFFRSYSSIPLEAPETLVKAQFRLSTFRQAKSVIWMISQHAMEPEWVSAGLQELVTNAIEHGNLGIGGQQKEGLIRESRWEAEIQRRLQLTENVGKAVVIEFDATGEEVWVAIEDQGEGFNWQDYFAKDISLANRVQGRGIVVARSVPAFQKITYLKGGSRVEVTFARPA